jgi:hypothetical protein
MNNNQNPQDLQSQNPNKQGPSIGDIIADVLRQRAESQGLNSISSAASHGKTDIAAQVEELKSIQGKANLSNEDEGISFFDFLQLIGALPEASHKEQKGEVEFKPQDYLNKKISIKIGVTDLDSNKKLKSKINLVLDGTGSVSFDGDSGLTEATDSLERANVIIFSTVVDAMKEFVNELGGDA